MMSIEYYENEPCQEVMSGAAGLRAALDLRPTVEQKVEQSILTLESQLEKLKELKELLKDHPEIQKILDLTRGLGI